MTIGLADNEGVRRAPEHSNGAGNMDSSNRTITVGLVGLGGCASQKLKRRAPARELAG